jgi:hypothetical protein
MYLPTFFLVSSLCFISCSTKTRSHKVPHENSGECQHTVNPQQCAPVTPKDVDVKDGERRKVNDVSKACASDCISVAGKLIKKIDACRIHQELSAASGAISNDSDLGLALGLLMKQYQISTEATHVLARKFKEKFAPDGKIIAPFKDCTTTFSYLGQ